MRSLLGSLAHFLIVTCLIIELAEFFVFSGCKCLVRWRSANIFSHLWVVLSLSWLCPWKRKFLMLVGGIWFIYFPIAYAFNILSKVALPNTRAQRLFWIVFLISNSPHLPWPVWLSRLEHQPVRFRQGTYLCCNSNFRPGHVQETTTNASLSHQCFSPPTPPLNTMKKCPRVRIKNKFPLFTADIQGSCWFLHIHLGPRHPAVTAYYSSSFFVDLFRFLIWTLTSCENKDSFISSFPIYKRSVWEIQILG